MPITARPIAFLLLVFSVPVPSPAGAQPAEKPALRSTLPKHVVALWLPL